MNYNEDNNIIKYTFLLYLNGHCSNVKYSISNSSINEALIIWVINNLIDVNTDKQYQFH